MMSDRSEGNTSVAPGKPIKDVLIVEDHELVAFALAEHLMKLEPSVSVRFARTLQAAVEAIGLAMPTLVFLDLGLQDSQGLDTLRRIVSIAPVPRTRVIVVSGHDQPALMRDARQAGASGYIAKSQSAAVQLDALRAVLRTGVYFPLALMQAGKHLSPRQQQVLSLLATGLTHKQIAEKLGITPDGVDTHVKRLYDFFNPAVRSRALLLEAAKKAGFLS